MLNLRILKDQIIDKCSFFYNNFIIFYPTIYQKVKLFSFHVALGNQYQKLLKFQILQNKPFHTGQKFKEVKILLWKVILHLLFSQKNHINLK